MSVPARPRGNGVKARGAVGAGTSRGARLAPLLLALGAAALALMIAGGIGLAFLLFRGARGETQEVVGSALPSGWQPGGEGGAGQVPPPPGGGPQPAPAGTAPPVAEAPPYAGAPGMAPADGEPPLEAGATPPPAVGDDGGPVETVPVASFEPPRLLYLPTPEYPRIGQQMSREGTVNLQVRVGANGRVLAADPVGERLGMGFEAAARRAAFNARFEPARRDGEPVEAETRISIRFRLQ